MAKSSLTESRNGWYISPTVTRRALNIAHRGASAEAPENTLAAFELALTQGADAIELDLHQTADGRIVVIHDFFLRRTTGDRRAVKSVSYSELRTLSSGSWFSPKFRNEVVPTLEAVLDLAKERTFLHLELKQGSSKYPEIEENLLRILSTAKAVHRVRVSSFDEAALARLRGLSRRLSLGLLTRRTKTGQILSLARRLGVASVHLSTKRYSRRTMAALQAAGFAVYVYTVDRPTAMRRYLADGVDGLFTNQPARLAGLLRNP